MIWMFVASSGAVARLYNKVLGIMRKFFIIMFACFIGHAVCMAQADSVKTKSSQSFGSAVSNFWKKTKQGIKDSGVAIADEFSHRPGEYRINGTFYMPLYDVNLYKGEDGSVLADTCRVMFNKRYPQALIQSCVLPQTDWIGEEVKKGDEIVGYLYTMYCYVVARDGTDGYINARFLFQRYRDVGRSPAALEGKYPLWERTDVIPAKDYEKLLEK